MAIQERIEWSGSSREQYLGVPGPFQRYSKSAKKVPYIVSELVGFEKDSLLNHWGLANFFAIL